MTDVLLGADGRPKCRWPLGDELYEDYHDAEWGRGWDDDIVLYEKIALEGFQAGLSWITVLRKRAAFRDAFAGFDPDVVAKYGDREVEAMLSNAGIIRHRGKIESAINNAKRAIEMIEEFGSLAAYCWRFAAAASQTAPRSFEDLAAITEASTALSKGLKRRGWSFVGPTTMHAFMQAAGMVNDHLVGCWAREPCERRRLDLVARYAG
ncbi:MAG: DNA-3-methyladenine glycosylase I [Actinomycetota bacterium]|jgi:DNA-3-methyladenine glycosylase I|nr:DNA-3-methyladenine glycosylase I [Actinomycetota bacterium]